MIPPRPAGATLLIACALAGAGGAVAWLPFLSLMLPTQVAAVAGDGRLALFTTAICIGIAVASTANILFGWLSDRHVERGGTRRRGVVIGLALLALAYGVAVLAASPVSILVAVATVQLAANALLAPLLALLAEAVPDARKGVLGALLAWAVPAGSAVAATLVAAPLSATLRLLVVPVIAAALILPLLAREHAAAPRTPVAVTMAPRGRRDLVVATVSQLLVQIAGAVLALYLVYYLASVMPLAAPSIVDAAAGTLMTVGHVVPLPLAFAAGRWSDRAGRRGPFLAAAGAITAAGLMAMAAAAEWRLAALGYCIAAVGTTAFLALNAARAMQALPDPRRRARDLALFNLANTLPSLIGAGLAWGLATPDDFSLLLLVLGALALLGGGLALAVSERVGAPSGERNPPSSVVAVPHRRSP